MAPSDIERFALDDERGFRAWLERHGRAIVLLRGVGCVYSSAFEKAFGEERAPEGYARAVRLVEEGGDGPVGEAYGVHVTPTLVCHHDGEEAARLPGRLLVGIPRTAYRRWLKTLPQADLSGR